MREVMVRSACAFWLAFAAAGCTPAFEPVTGTIADTTLPDAEKLLESAHAHFVAQEYGKAVDAYARTVEVDSRNPEAWLGLAASYDQVRRFDQADAAYAKVQDLMGTTANVLNNMGYSYMLRGNFQRSRETLQAAHNADPHNPYILNNIALLNAKLADEGKPPLEVR